jgi:hypothetical protein
VDESVVEHLLETVSVTRETLAVWRESMQRQTNQADPAEFTNSGWQSDFEPFSRLFSLIEQSIALQESHLLGQEPNRTRKLFPFMPALREAAGLTGQDLAAIISECQALPTGTKTGRYSWERPFTQFNGKLCFPLHFGRELVDAHHNELKAGAADTRFWFSLQKECLAVNVFQPRQHLLAILRGETADNKTELYRNHFQQAPGLVILDATPSPVLQKYVLNSATRVVKFEVAQHLVITQLTNSLYTKDELGAREGKALGEVSRLLQQESGRYRSAAIFCHKAFNPAAGAGPLKLNVQPSATHLTWGHFDRDNKALNSLSEVEFIAVVGHYCHPLDTLRAQVQAFRFGTSSQEGGGADNEDNLWKLRPYAWTDQEGKGVARRCRSDSDPEVQAAIEHSEQAAILQAVGRGRPTLRSPEKPLKVLLVTAIPLGNALPVARLAEARELAGQNVLSLAQAQALAQGRRQRLDYHRGRRSELARRLSLIFDKCAEEAGLTGPAYLTQPVLAHLSGTPGWQLNLLGLNRTIRLQPENKAVCGPELYLYFYKPIPSAFRFVFNSSPLLSRLFKRAGTLNRAKTRVKPAARVWFPGFSRLVSDNH